MDVVSVVENKPLSRVTETDTTRGLGCRQDWPRVDVVVLRIFEHRESFSQQLRILQRLRAALRRWNLLQKNNHAPHCLDERALWARLCISTGKKVTAPASA